MVRLTQFVLAIALLSGPAYADNNIVLLCSGTQALEDGVPRRITRQTLTINLDNKTVSGFLGDLAVIGVSQTYISLRGRGEDSDLGFFRRYSGEAILASPKRAYDLNCKPR